MEMDNVDSPANPRLEPVLISLFFVKFEGEKISIENFSTDRTISELKQIISKRKNIPIENLRLVFMGKILKDQDQISVYSIKENSLIQLVGGNKPRAQIEPKKQPNQHHAVPVNIPNATSKKVSIRVSPNNSVQVTTNANNQHNHNHVSNPMISEFLTASKTGDLATIKNLLENSKVDVFAAPRERISALHAAAMFGHKSVCIYLLEYCKNNVTRLLEAKNNRGETALHYACYHNKKDIVEILVKNYHANIFDRITVVPNKTPLLLAASKGNDEVVQFLISQGAEINDRDSNGVNSMMIAAQTGNWSTCKLLWEYKVDWLTPLDRTRVTAFAHLFYFENHTEDTFDFFLEKGFDPHEISAKKANLFLLATHANKFPEIGFQKLLKLGVDINCQNDEGLGCLHLKIGPKAANFFLENKIKLNRSNHKGESEIHCQILFENWEVVNLLLEKNVNVFSKTNLNVGLLHLSIEKNAVELTKLLIEKGCDIRMAEQTGKQTPFLLSVQQGNFDLVHLMIKTDPKCIEDINMQGNSGLHLSVLKKNVAIVSYLVRETAIDLLTKNTAGKTPIELAKELNYQEILTALNGRQI